MNRKSVGINENVSFRLERRMQSFAVILPLLVVAYGLMIHFGLTEGSAFYKPINIIMLILASLVLGVLQASVKRSTVGTRAGFVIVHHILLAFGLLYVFGVQGPMLLMWLFMVIVTTSIFGQKWALLSYIGLFIVMCSDIALTHNFRIATLATYGLNAAFVGVLALFFTALRTLEVSEQKKLAAAHAKQLEQREALLTIINGTAQAIFTVNKKGVIRVYNAALLSLIDTNQSLSGRRVDDILNTYDDKGEPISLFGLMKSTSHFERDDLRLKFADGDEMRLQLSVNKIQTAFSPQHQNDGEGYVCMVRDVTKQKSLEEERDEFISVVSHELRTPVTITEGTISNVQYFMENGADPKKLSASLQEAHEQVLLLANMINDLGTLSRAERGVGDTAEVIDIKELSETLFKNYQPDAAKKGLKLNLDTGTKLGTITTSRLYLEEMLQNFITNSIKYTAKGSVTIQVRRAEGGVEFAIKDTGIGISKSDIKHVFEKFYRSEDYRTRETSGTGLGLYVVSKLAHKLGTRIEVTSRLNHGSTFHFVIKDFTPSTKA